jgi:hypothetical protein
MVSMKVEKVLTNVPSNVGKLRYVRCQVNDVGGIYQRWGLSLWCHVLREFFKGVMWITDWVVHVRLVLLEHMTGRSLVNHLRGLLTVATKTNVNSPCSFHKVRHEVEKGNVDQGAADSQNEVCLDST